MAASSRELETAVRSSPDPIDIATKIADEIARPAAREVDREASFPRAALKALAEQGLLSMLVPCELGGLGCSLSQVAEVTERLARGCSSTGMIFAMHQIQIASLVWHGDSPWFRAHLKACAKEQRLIASVTSELGVGGDLRTSKAAVESDADGRARLEKQAPTVSYGAHADDLLISARRAPDAAPSDQVLVLCRAQDVELEQTGTWNTLGMRGTCSPGFVVRARFGADQIVPVPFAEIASRTMVPVSHLLWSAVWLGIALEAFARAQRHVRAEARKLPGSMPPGALRLAEARVELDGMRARLDAALFEYESLRATAGGRERLASLGYATKLNCLKIAMSEHVVDVVTRSLRILGIAGYREEGELAIGRLLRDAHSAALMINNDRIHGANSSMLLVQKEIA